MFPFPPHHHNHHRNQQHHQKQAASESRDDYLESLLKKNSMEDPKFPNGTSGGGGDVDGENCGSSAGLPEFDASDGGGGEKRNGAAVMWKCDADEERRSHGTSSGWEDVEG